MESMSSPDEWTISLICLLSTYTNKLINYKKFSKCSERRKFFIKIMKIYMNSELSPLHTALYSIPLKQSNVWNTCLSIFNIQIAHIFKYQINEEGRRPSSEREKDHFRDRPSVLSSNFLGNKREKHSLELLFTKWTFGEWMVI